MFFGEIVTVADQLLCVLCWKGGKIHVGLCESPVLFPYLEASHARTFTQGGHRLHRPSLVVTTSSSSVAYLILIMCGCVQ